MQQRHQDRFQYFKELCNTSRDYYVAYVSRYLRLNADTRVLEIGCGEGGNLLPFASLGCEVTGMDIDRGRIEQAKHFFKERGQHGLFFVQDFTSCPVPQAEDERYNLVLIHDVIEHIPSSVKLDFISHIRGFLRSGGIVFFGFPAWQNPFGGHQQISDGFTSKLPFIHLLPSSLYRRLLRFGGATDGQIEELLYIKEAQVTIECFERLAHTAGYSILDRTLWFINPHYKQKFNLKPRRLFSVFCHLPFVRNFLTTSAFYILSIREKA